MPWAILDTDVYINHWERRRSGSDLGSVARGFIIRQSAVVLSELRRGARSREARKLLATLFQVSRIQWSPTAADWWEAGRLIQRLGDRQSWDPRRRRDFQNDVLIGLTARRYGATIVTTNRTDFELIAREVGISLLAV